MENVYDKLKGGVLEVISDKEFNLLLNNKRDLVIKIGFDPTSNKLHLGHLVILKKLRDFQDLGYFIHIVIGDFTATIGDPSGKNSSRQSILKSVVVKNYMNYDTYFLKVLDPSKLILYFNSVWFNFMLLGDFVQLLSLTTISRLLERSDFKNRYLKNLSIGIHEFVYPLLQGYDSVFLLADIEIGGIDQKFNLLLARDMQKKFYQKTQVLLMMPILMGLDGKNKMSKSLNNYVALNSDPYDLFCKIMSIPDNLLKDYYFAFNLMSSYHLNKLFGDKKDIDYMKLKLDLSFKVVSFLHDSVVAKDSKLKFINRVSLGIYDDMEPVDFLLFQDSILLSELLLKLNLIDSLSKFKHFIKFSSISIDGILVKDRNFTLFAGSIYLIKVGKKKIVKIFLKYNKI